MANMSHCRFRNTLADLRDCYEHLDDDDLSGEEMDALHKLVKLCDWIASAYVIEGDPTSGQ